MEDAHITETKISARDLSGETVLDLPGHAVFGVFDGHGGSFAAIYSGRNFCRVLCSRQQFFQYASQTSAQRENDPNSLSMLKEALRAAFIDLDLEIACTLKGQHVEGADQSFSLADAGPGSQDTSAQVTEDGEPTLRLIQQESNAGTTACIVLITPTHIICANAGDSRSVLSRNSNIVVPLSFDHKPENEEEEKRIRAAGGYVACGRVDSDLSVSRGLGDFRHKNMGVVMKESIQPGQTSSVQRPEDQKVSPVPDFVIEKRNELHDEFVMIACDGIWDVRSNDEGIKLVADIFEEGETDVGLMCEEVRTDKVPSLLALLTLGIRCVMNAFSSAVKII